MSTPSSSSSSRLGRPTADDVAIKRAAAAAAAPWPPLHAVTTPTLPTRQVAHYVGRSIDTLRNWARTNPSCTPPMLPLRTARGGPLLWRTADVRRLVGDAAGAAGGVS
jgi:hypothetical protein